MFLWGHYKVLESICTLHPISFNKFIKENNYNYTGQIEKYYFELSNFHIYANLSAETILTRLRNIIEYIDLDLDLDSISFSVK